LPLKLQVQAAQAGSERAGARMSLRGLALSAKQGNSFNHQFFRSSIIDHQSEGRCI
jgi:hypothetical protein